MPSQKCIICTENDLCELLLPCKHIITCTECTDKILDTTNECPMCRKQIEDNITVFINGFVEDDSTNIVNTNDLDTEFKLIDKDYNRLKILINIDDIKLRNIYINYALKINICAIQYVNDNINISADVIPDFDKITTDLGEFPSVPILLKLLKYCSCYFQQIYEKYKIAFQFLNKNMIINVLSDINNISTLAEFDLIHLDNHINDDYIDRIVETFISVLSNDYNSINVTTVNTILTKFIPFTILYNKTISRLGTSSSFCDHINFSDFSSNHLTEQLFNNFCACQLSHVIESLGDTLKYQKFYNSFVKSVINNNYYGILCRSFKQEKKLTYDMCRSILTRMTELVFKMFFDNKQICNQYIKMIIKLQIIIDKLCVINNHKKTDCDCNEKIHSSWCTKAWMLACAIDSKHILTCRNIPFLSDINFNKILEFIVKHHGNQFVVTIDNALIDDLVYVIRKNPGIVDHFYVKKINTLTCNSLYELLLRKYITKEQTTTIINQSLTSNNTNIYDLMLKEYNMIHIHIFFSIYNVVDDVMLMKYINDINQKMSGNGIDVNYNIYSIILSHYVAEHYNITKKTDALDLIAQIKNRPNSDSLIGRVISKTQIIPESIQLTNLTDNDLLMIITELNYNDNHFMITQSNEFMVTLVARIINRPENLEFLFGNFRGSLKAIGVTIFVSMLEVLDSTKQLASNSADNLIFFQNLEKIYDPICDFLTSFTKSIDVNNVKLLKGQLQYLPKKLQSFQLCYNHVKNYPSDIKYVNSIFGFGLKRDVMRSLGMK